MPRLVIQKGQGIGRDQVLGTQAVVVGRDPGVDFPLEDHLASRRHFRVVAEGGAWWVEDLGSTNGTLVNARRTERAQLMDGDVIQAGETQVAFVQKDLLGGGGARGARAVRTPPVKAAPANAPKTAPANAPKTAPAGAPKVAPTPERPTRKLPSAPVRRRRRR